ncbi:hypothetical protein OG418_48890 [Streptomyces phaeochromogenes]|uniref:hypothetical protein n=1 Tax=Streptomyces phaeochromogenes TaxID=1923 RepID=UPI00324DF091
MSEDLADRARSGGLVDATEVVGVRQHDHFQSAGAGRELGHDQADDQQKYRHLRERHQERSREARRQGEPVPERIAGRHAVTS